GNKISEPLAILRVMSTKQPGDKLTVKVMRGRRMLDFTYDVMKRDQNSPPPVKANPTVITDHSAPITTHDTKLTVSDPQSGERVMSQGVQLTVSQRQAVVDSIMTLRKLLSAIEVGPS